MFKLFTLQVTNVGLLQAFELSDEQEHAVVRLLQLGLLGLLGFAIYTGNVGVGVNAAGALVVTLLPALLNREYHLHMDAGITLLITVAVSLHTIGILGPYQSISWWDTLTHAFSGFLATGIGYAVVQAIDEHVDSVDIPGRFLPVFLFVFAVATGVFWEVIEFAATRLSSLYGGKSVLIVFGPGDIVTDLVFTALGGIILALIGTEYFEGLARKLDLVLAR